MYLFDIKSKDKKKKNVSSVYKTLDNKHTEMVLHFKNLQESLPTKKQELKNLCDEYDEICLLYKKCDPSHDTYSELFVKKKNMEFKIEEKKKDIEKIENKYEENEYYIKVGDILFDYYKMFETDKNEINSEDYEVSPHVKEKDVSESESDELGEEFIENDSDSDSDIANQMNESSDKQSKNKEKTIFDFFSQPQNINQKISSMDECNFIQKDIMSFFDTETTDTKTNTKSILHTKYMQEIQRYYSPEIRKVNLTACPECGIERVMMVTEGIFVCQECCFMEKVIVDSERPSFREPPPEISYFAYKRINHFNEWLNQFQAKESSEIPQEVFDQIILELKKEKNLNLRNLKKSRVREILSKLKLNRYYEHVSHIIYKINSVPPPSIPTDLEEILRNMFRTIQGPFMKVCPQISKKRKNFLSYSYVLFKFLELLGYDELKKQFPLLKCREKLHKQDKIWQGICKEVGWQFIRSI